jgi:hypothetical protein
VGAASAVADVQERTRSLRAALEAPSFTERFAGLLAVPVKAPGPSEVSLHGAIAGLSDAVRSASEAIGAIPRRDRDEMLAVVLRDVHAQMRRGEASVSLHEPSVAPASIRRASAHSPEALLSLAHALDLYLPALERAAAEPSAESVEGCDVRDELPFLCVGSGAANVYTEDAALLIDLGGNDVYRNSAGGAPVLVHEAGAVSQVSVNIDIAGNDVYETAPNDQGLVLGLGFGMFGGVGILVDHAGDDIYRSGVEPAKDGGRVVVMSQGAGLGGTGVLFDETGSDSYEVGEHASFVLAQGAGHFCAFATETEPPFEGSGCPLGALLDLTIGTDSYAISPAQPGPGEAVEVRAQAYANFGTGVLYEANGTAGISITTHTRNEQADPTVPAPAAQVLGQSIALSGSSYLLAGAFPTRYEIDMTSDGKAFNRAWGQSTAVLEGSTAVIQDLGGNDTYTARLRMTDQRTLIVDDDCGCDHAEAVVDIANAPGIIYDIDANLQALGLHRGVALIEDDSGNDVYVADGEHVLDVTLSDRLGAPVAPPRLHVTSYGSPGIEGQGAAKQASVGVLLDRSGTDTYELLSANTVTADANSINAGGTPEVTAVAQPRLHVRGQGAGDELGALGALLDLAGTADRFTAAAPVTATTSPDPAGASQRGGDWPWFHGTYGGVFVADGQSPHIVSSPSRPVCRTSTARRGIGTWSDCSISSDDPEHQVMGAIPIWIQYSHGEARGATGASPTIEFFDTATSVAKGARLPISVRLHLPGGAPIPGATLHLALQDGCWPVCALTPQALETAAGTYWTNVWEVAAVTDDQGVARASLPAVVGPPLSPDQTYRVLATYDGSDGIYPRHVAHPIILETG